MKRTKKKSVTSKQKEHLLSDEIWSYVNYFIDHDLTNAFPKVFFSSSGETSYKGFQGLQIHWPDSRQKNGHATQF